MSKTTQEFARLYSVDYDIDSLSPDDEVMNRQIKELFPNIPFDKLHLPPFGHWKGELIELANSLSRDKHSQHFLFMDAVMMYVSGVRKGPLIEWMKKMIAELCINPSAIVSVPTLFK